MQNPVDEIVPLVKRLVSSPSPSQLQADFESYFTPNAGFRHPLCLVKPGPSSRNRILGVYKQYRAMSPHTDADVRVLAYDESKNLLIIEVVQRFHIVTSPVPPAPSRLVTHITLNQDPHTRLHYIAYQEDFYHPDHFTNLVAPDLAPVVRFALKSSVFFCNLFAPLGTLFGLFVDSPGAPVAASSSRVPTISLLQRIGRFLLARNKKRRASGSKWNDDDIVPTVPGEEEVLFNPKSRSGWSSR
jgi:hypothetical protein